MYKTVLTFLLCSFILNLGCAQQEDILKYSLPTKWASQVSQELPWNVYPRPQLKRQNWTNLNGPWDYAIRAKGSVAPNNYDGKILVPFAVESELSGVKKTVGEEKILWYRRTFNAKIPKNGNRIQLHFGAVDWDATVFVNGNLVGNHKGGYTSFSFDITPFLKKKGIQELTVRVWDPTDKGIQARGKQLSEPQGIWYTPVTGIWQTVWLEETPRDHLKSVKITPDIDKGTIQLSCKTPPVSQKIIGKITVRAGEKEIITQQLDFEPGDHYAATEINIPNVRLWSPSDPFLYEVVIQLQGLQGTLIDEVDTYFGMRKVALGKDPNGYVRLLLNNQPYFQFGLLDQGWWPDGLYTAPSESALMYDVEMTQAFGFNMLRKHVKVEPASYYYNCDKMGMLVWQDMPNGNYFRDLRVKPADVYDADRPLASAQQFEKELKEMMDQLHHFPSIITWVPFNEGWGQYDTERIATWVKQYDPSRFCIASSGWADRGIGDMIDAHLYPGPGMEPVEARRASVLGEFGGLGLPVEGHMWWDKRNWGYLTFREETVLVDEFKSIIQDLIGLKAWGLSAAIYTQTTDVEGEVNGLMTYDRKVLKLDPAQTRDWFAPLYQPMWNRRLYVLDSENEPQSWKIAVETPVGQWTATDFEDANWTSVMGPFSSFNNFFLSKDHHRWNPQQTIYARKHFYINELPNQLYLKYYLLKSEAVVYLNGVKLTEIKHQGGRKRHYSHAYLEDAERYLKKGKNTIAFVMKSMEKECSFDLGLYGTGMVNSNRADRGHKHLDSKDSNNE